MSDDPTRSVSHSPDELTSTASPSGDFAREQEPIPSRLGRYTILRVLGKGGMGLVYEAKQENPSRTVALKVVRAGYLSPELLRRFGQESQVLGRLQHPGIAQVYEAGMARDDRGRDLPFFAMEFIKGVPLTEYARLKDLGTRDRLELVAKVCDAVYHAHQKGVIHRDLKPGNIIVDELGQPKILDFGVARATDSDIQQTTLQTDIGQLVGTIPYMSPEQVSGDPNDLDTRSDVYALGVIAYELLAGRKPYDTRKKMIHEAARIIKEEEPTRLSSFNRTLRGDVETIVAKALEKDKIRRYQSAESLASDIRRYLRSEPIAARPASTWYQLQRFSSRNTGLVAGIAAAFVLLVAGLIGTSYGMRQAITARNAEAQQHKAADEQRDRAITAESESKKRADELKLVSDFQSQMLAQIDPTKAGKDLSDDVTAKFAASLTKAKIPDGDQPAQVQAFRSQWAKVNATDAALELIDRTILKPAVEAIDKQFKDQPVVDAQLRQTLATRYWELGLYNAAMPLQESALSTRRRVLGEDNPDTLNSMNSMGFLLQDQGKLAEAEPFFRTALEKRRRILGENHPDTLDSINNLGVFLQEQGNLADAEPLLREALERRQKVLGEDHRETLNSVNNVGFLLETQGKLNEAEPYLRKALEGRRRVLGEDDRHTLQAINNLGLLLKNQGRLAEAEPYYAEVLEKSRRLMGEEYLDTLTAINNMGGLLRAQNKLAEALPYYVEALEKRRRVLGDDHPHTLSSLNNMGSLLQSMGKPTDAEPFLREALERRRRVLGDTHLDTLATISNLGSLLREQGRFAETIELLAPAEAATRKSSTGSNARRIAVLLTNLGRARAGLAKTPAEFAAAESNLLEAHSIYLKAVGEKHKETRDCAQVLVAFYTIWDKADPGNGHEAKSAEWKAKLEAANTPAPTTQTSDKK